ARLLFTQAEAVRRGAARGEAVDGSRREELRGLEDRGLRRVLPEEVRRGRRRPTARARPASRRGRPGHRERGRARASILLRTEVRARAPAPRRRDDAQGLEARRESALLPRRRRDELEEDRGRRALIQRGAQARPDEQGPARPPR